jgi:hypothetical protein
MQNLWNSLCCLPYCWSGGLYSVIVHFHHSGTAVVKHLQNDHVVEQQHIQHLCGEPHIGYSLPLCIRQFYLLTLTVSLRLYTFQPESFTLSISYGIVVTPVHWKKKQITLTVWQNLRESSKCSEIHEHRTCHTHRGGDRKMSFTFY